MSDAMEESGLVQLLEAEYHRAYALSMVKRLIEADDADYAMHYQFSYLYWCDEWLRLYKDHGREYLDFKCLVTKDILTF